MITSFLTGTRPLLIMVWSTLSVCTVAAQAAEDKTGLTLEDKYSLLSLYGLRQNDTSRIDGARRYGSAKAGAKIFGQIRETKQGTCFTWRLIVIGKIVDNAVQWTKEEYPQRDQLVLLRDERKGRPCSDMLDSPAILLGSPVEENTIQRIQKQSLRLALEAGRQLREPISASEIREGRTTRLEVDSLGELVGSGTYRLTWTINQCLRLIIAVESGNKGEFEVVHVRRIVC